MMANAEKEINIHQRFAVTLLFNVTFYKICPLHGFGIIYMGREMVLVRFYL